MAQTWEFKSSPYPQLEALHSVIKENKVIHDDVWVTTASLSVVKHIPGVPAVYTYEEQQGLVLYVRGFPFNVSSNGVKDIFMPFGKVNKSPMLICLGSGHTFRWVVMKHADDAQDALKALHGSTHEQGGQLFISMALSAGEVFELQGRDLPGGYRYTKENIAQGNSAIGHAHPSPPAVRISKPVLPAVPRIAVPIIPRPGGLNVSTPARPPGLPIRPAAQQPIAAPSQQAKIVPSIQKPAGSDQKSSSASASSGDTTVKATQAAKPAPAIPSSWANIASSSDPSTRIIELNPSHKSTNLAPRLNRVGRIPSIVVRVPEDPLHEQMRLVFLLNLPNTIGLEEITAAVKEGPLVRIQFGHDNDTQARFVGIIFQYAEHAEAFYKALIRERERSRPEKFRFIVDVVKGDPFPMDDTIRAMSEDPLATRRLTIVKGGFFFMFGERQLKDLCNKIAGKDNVQKVWLYNGGNATVVFADVASAIKVKNVLDKRASDGAKGVESEVWKGLQTTFSKDPCIHFVEYKTAMQ